MRIARLHYQSWVLIAAAAMHGAAQDDEVATTIIRDVAIIGGGAAGSYAAVRLRQDYNVSVVLIEKEAVLVRWEQMSRGMLDSMRRALTSGCVTGRTCHYLGRSGHRQGLRRWSTKLYRHWRWQSILHTLGHQHDGQPPLSQYPVIH